MRQSTKHCIVTGVLMISAAFASSWILPKADVSSENAGSLLTNLVPNSFGHWRAKAPIRTITALEPLYDVEERVGYGEVLSRTYGNDRGDLIMLSIVYGDRQSDGMTIHLPEVCYTAQGFSVSDTRIHTIGVGERNLMVRRLSATRGIRHEPITYWLLAAGSNVDSRTQRKLEQIKQGIRGRITDGLLVRISSITRNEEDAFDVHEHFLHELSASLSGSEQSQLFGQISDYDTG